MRPTAWTRLAGVALGAGLLGLVLLVGLRRIRAPDTWFHLSTGRWIWEHASVPHEDVLSYSAHGAPYVDIHWLFQLGLYGLQALGGHAAIVVAKTLAVGLLAAILAACGWRRERPWVAALGTGLALVAASDRFLARPELCTFVLLAANLALLERCALRGERRLWALVPLQIAWVNTHGLFALGVATCALYLCGAAWRARGRGADRAPLCRLAAVAAAVLACSLVSPSGVRGALYPLGQLGTIAPLGEAGSKLAVTETAPLWRTDLAPFVPALALAALAGLALALGWRRDARRVERALVFLAFLGLFAIANRNVALLAIAGAIVGMRCANEVLERRPAGARLELAASALVLALLGWISVEIASGRYDERTRTYHEPGLGTVALFVPEGAADWIERERPPGRVAHSMLSGGYLGWRLWPHYEVLCDGRLEVYGPALLQRLALSGPAAFQRLDAQYGFGSVVLLSFFDPPELVAWLRASDAWRLVHADALSVVFVRADPATAARWPEVVPRGPDALPLPDAPTALGRRVYAAARQRLLVALRRGAALRAEAARSSR